MIALPPLLVGAVKATLAWPLPGVAAPMVGAPGGVAATTVKVTVIAAAKFCPVWMGSMVLSSTRMLGVNEPEAVGVPVSWPLRDRDVPVGSAGDPKSSE